MDANGAVEISFCGAGRDGHTDRLHHLRGIVAQHVSAHDALACLIDNQFHRGPMPAPRHQMTHRHELGHIHIHRTVHGRILLRHATRADRGHREYGRGDGIEGPASRMLGKQAVCQMVPLGYGDRGQVHLVGNVANCEDVRLACGILRIYDHRPVRGQFNTRDIQPHGPCVRNPAYREEHKIAVKAAPICQMHALGPVCHQFQSMEHHARVKLDAIALEYFDKSLAYIVVEATQRHTLPIQQIDFGAEAAKYAGELDPDIAAADQCHALGTSRQRESLIRNDAMLRAFNLGPGGMTAYCDHDTLGRDTATAYLHCMGVQKHSFFKEPADTGIL